MTRRSTRHGPRAVDEHDALSANESILEGVDQSRAIFLRGMLVVQQETLHFVNRRLEQDADLLREYRDCRTMMDMIAAQQKWFVHLSQDYYLEGIRLAKFMSGMVSSEANEMSRGMDEAEDRAAA